MKPCIYIYIHIYIHTHNLWEPCKTVGSGWLRYDPLIENFDHGSYDFSDSVARELLHADLLADAAGVGSHLLVVSVVPYLDA